MSARSLCLIAWMMAFVPATAHADLTWYVNDYEGFLAAAGNVQVIDFETLPDGSPSYSGAEITPEFNYTEQGVTFSTPAPSLTIVGNAVTGFDLRADVYPSFDPTWLISDMAIPVTALGAFSSTVWSLDLYDADGGLLGTETVVASGVTFLGATSDIPIARAIASQDTWSMNLDSLAFRPIPEPSTLVCIALAVPMILGRKPNS